MIIMVVYFSITIYTLVAHARHRPGPTHPCRCTHRRGRLNGDWTALGWLSAELRHLCRMHQHHRVEEQGTVGDYPKRNHAPNSGPIPLRLGRVWLYCSGERILPPYATAKLIQFLKRTANISDFLQPLRDKPHLLLWGERIVLIQKGARFLR